MTQEHEATKRALEHDIEVLEEKAKVTAQLIAVRVAPAVAIVLALLVVAWILGRRARRQ